MNKRYTLIYFKDSNSFTVVEETTTKYTLKQRVKVKYDEEWYTGQVQKIGKVILIF